MEIIRLSPQLFDSHFPDAHCFSRSEFTELNADTCDEVHYLAFKETKMRLGLIAGQQDSTLYSPFSAPFGGLITNDSTIKVEYVEKAVGLLETYAVQYGMKQIVLVLPPLFYDMPFYTKLSHVLNGRAWQLLADDLNFFVDLQYTTQANHFGMTYSARKNLKTALKHPFMLEKGQSKEHLAQAYHIIAANRSSKGYTLSVPEKRFMETTAAVIMDAFLLRLEEQYVASAIVYHVTPGIPLVVYWGDLPGFESFRTMNFLTHGVIDSYRNAGYAFLDTGTAMLGDKPNPGLCVFKESIGCSILPRYTFVKQLR